MGNRKTPRSRKHNLIEGARHHDDKPATRANLQPLEERVPASVFRGEVVAWAKRVGVEPREVRLRSMKRKWASCSSRGRLTFDTALLAQPARKRAEVIVHELLHLRIPNHGKLFEALLRGYLDSIYLPYAPQPPPPFTFGNNPIACSSVSTAPKPRPLE